MNTINISDKNFTAQVPASWNELTKKQLMYIASQWRVWQFTTHPVLKIKLFMVLAGIGRWNIFNRQRRVLLALLPKRRDYKKMSAEKYSEKYYYLPDFIRLTDFIFNAHIGLTVNKLPEIKAGKMVLHGPSDSLNSLSFQEFVYVDGFYLAYCATKDIEQLNNMIVCMYRPRNPNLDVLAKDYTGDMRAPFNSNAVDIWLPAVKKLPLEVKTAIYLFYTGCRQKMEKDYASVFSAGDETENGDGDGWYGVLSNLPSEKFGTLAERENTPVHTVFQELNIIMKKYVKK